MPHAISQYDGVMTIRLQGKLNPQELYQDVKKYLDSESGGLVIAFVDFTLVTGTVGQQIKQVLFRALQHHNVSKIGFFGAALDIQRELADLIPLLGRARPVFTDLTDADLRTKMGLTRQQSERSPGGMLKYLQNKQNAQKTAV